MKLSIVIAMYRSAKELERYLDRVLNLQKQIHEFIFVVNTNIDKSLAIIDKYRKILKVKIKVVFNSRRLNECDSILQATKLAEGDYLMIQSLNFQYDDELILSLLKEAKAKQSDIIEFKPWFASPIKWKPGIRKAFNKVTKIVDRKDIFAYTFPLNFNKIYKRELFEKIDIVPTLVSWSNDYSIEFVFKLLLVAKTYSTVAINPIKIRKYLEKSFNPLKIIREFELIISADIYKDYLQEIQYNKYFCENMLYLVLMRESKNKVLIEKFINRVNKSYESSDFFTLNKYYLSSKAEVAKLEEWRKKFAQKAYPIFDDKN